MTSPPRRPQPVDVGTIVEQLAEIAALMRTLIEDTVPNLEDKISMVEGKTDRRAKIFRNLWLAGSTAFVIACLLGSLVAHRLFVDLHNANLQQQQANRQASCFQLWANATARRTGEVSAASNRRVNALDHLLDVRSRYSADSPQAKRAIRQAALAGDKYEDVVANNPPVPPLQVYCAPGGTREPAGGSGFGDSFGGGGQTSAAPSSGTATSNAASSSSTPTPTATATSGSTPRATATTRVTTTRTAPSQPRATRTVTTTSTPTSSGGLLCPVVNLVLHC